MHQSFTLCWVSHPNKMPFFASALQKMCPFIACVFQYFVPKIGWVKLFFENIFCFAHATYVTVFWMTHPTYVTVFGSSIQILRGIKSAEFKKSADFRISIFCTLSRKHFVWTLMVYAAASWIITPTLHC